MALARPLLSDTPGFLAPLPPPPVSPLHDRRAAHPGFQPQHSGHSVPQPLSLGGRVSERWGGGSSNRNLGPPTPAEQGFKTPPCT